jgi:ADP-ribosylglycohydrolase
MNASSPAPARGSRLALQSRYRGCLLAGAAGDALGAAVEFDSLTEIRDRFGPGGIRDFAPAYGRLGAITDDTQMTLFTAEGLLRAAVCRAQSGACDAPSVVHRAYLRWLKTQGESSSLDVPMDGWLGPLRPLWSRRAPGLTCQSALVKAPSLGQSARNHSKGCGGVMRIAPVGLVCPPGQAFETGSELAALTHGHPSSSLSAGLLADLIARLVAGDSLEAALAAAKAMLPARPDHGEVLSAIEKAEGLVASGTPPAGKVVEVLGGGWVAEEALAIALYCVLATPSLEEAIVLAVNHSGDSDSTGSIAGNIAGVMRGVEAIPARWIADLELREEITAVADDLVALKSGTLDLLSPSVQARYPGS